MDKARYIRREIDPRAPKQPRIQSTAESTGGKIAGLTFAVCFAIALIMLTIKLGLVLFG